MNDLDRPAPRPRYSVLSDASLRRYGIRVRHWREAIPDYLAQRAALKGAEQPAARAVHRS